MRTLRVSKIRALTIFDSNSFRQPWSIRVAGPIPDQGVQTGSPRLGNQALDAEVAVDRRVDDVVESRCVAHERSALAAGRRPRVIAALDERGDEDVDLVDLADIQKRAQNQAAPLDQ